MTPLSHLKQKADKTFEKLFMYKRKGYLEFDLMKVGNVGTLIEFYHNLFDQAYKIGKIEGLKDKK